MSIKMDLCRSLKLLLKVSTFSLLLLENSQSLGTVLLALFGVGLHVFHGKYKKNSRLTPWKATTDLGTNFPKDLLYNLNKGVCFYTIDY